MNFRWFFLLLVGTITLIVLSPRVMMAEDGKSIYVTDGPSLEAAINSANSAGGYHTIVLEDGVYTIGQMLHIYTDGITVKSESGDYKSVVIKGAGMYGHVSHIFLVAGNNFLVENVSMGEVSNHVIQVQGEKGVVSPVVRGCRLFDSYEQLLKVSGKGENGQRAVGGLVEDCLFEYTAGIGPQYYIGGVDAHASDNWVVKDNLFRDISSPETKLAEHAIHFWSGSKGTVVSNNRIIHCDRGIGFGLGASSHEQGRISGNYIYASRDVGIGLENASGVEVMDNFVYAPNYINAIEYRFEATSANIHDNITYGAIAARNGGQATLANNLLTEQAQWSVTKEDVVYKEVAESSTTNKPSDWALEAVTYLSETTAIDERLYSNYKTAISRQTFSHLIVKLYESLTGEALPQPTITSVFMDTSNEDVLKAYVLGLINGYGQGVFGPDDSVTREQVAVMLVRTIEKAGYTLSTTNDVFNDEKDISDWALKSIRKAYNENIMRGTGNAYIEPKALTTREQALVLIYNILEKQAELKLGSIGDQTPVIKSGVIQKPTLTWQHGGAFNSWAETGWYSTPEVVDLDGDGMVDMIGSAYSVVALDGATGALQWRVKSGFDREQPSADNVGRTWSDVVVKDIDGDGNLEVITAHGGGVVSVYDHLGYFKSGWPKQPIERELRGLKVADLDLDGTEEIIVTGAVNNKENIWVYEHDGSLRTGWPQLSNDSGYAYGVFNNNVSIGDITGDGTLEIILPSDVHYICAYDDHGNQLPTNIIYGDRGWGKVGVWESLEVEVRGWGKLEGPREERNRANFAHGASVIADVDGNGVNEVVSIGNVYDAMVGHPPGIYNGVYIFNGDRSRFNNGVYDWTTLPLDTGGPLSEDYNIIESNQPDPVVKDMDGDGLKEIVFSSYDGRVHCYNLDKTEHNAWPYTLNQSGGLAFASVPEVVDLNNDGFMEVIFTSWREKTSGLSGSLYVLDYKGTLLYQVPLPTSKSVGKANGALASPKVVDSNNDGNYEIYLNTVTGGFARYDIMVK